MRHPHRIDEDDEEHVYALSEYFLQNLVRQKQDEWLLIRDFFQRLQKNRSALPVIYPQQLLLYASLMALAIQEVLGFWCFL